MAVLVPSAALIPLHGVVQLGSNIGRTALLWRFIQWQTVLPFTVGAVLGSALGGSVVRELPESWLYASLSGFILYAVLLKTQQMPRQPHMATFSASMSLQHGVKIAAFGFLGFQFLPWLGLLAAMIASGFIGTWLGQRWLSGRADVSFHRGLNWLLSALALQLLWRAISTEF